MIPVSRPPLPCCGTTAALAERHRRGVSRTEPNRTASRGAEHKYEDPMSCSTTRGQAEPGFQGGNPGRGIGTQPANTQHAAGLPFRCSCSRFAANRLRVWPVGAAWSVAMGGFQEGNRALSAGCGTMTTTTEPSRTGPSRTVRPTRLPVVARRAQKPNCLEPRSTGMAVRGERGPIQGVVPLVPRLGAVGHRLTAPVVAREAGKPNRTPAAGCRLRAAGTVVGPAGPFRTVPLPTGCSTNGLKAKPDGGTLP